MFNALLNLYQSHSSNTPLERFTTEAFCGVLRSDSALLESFLRKFAGIENETGFEIFTEKSYPYNGSNPRIDVAFKNKNYLIFLEIKVDSPEGERGGLGQLEIYANILKHQTKKVVLLFCTKYQEIKNPDLYTPTPFKQLLWREIFSYLQKENELKQNCLTTEFLKYLEIQKMSKPPKLSLEDLDKIKTITPMFDYFDECFKLIKPCFKNKFKEERLFASLETHSNRYILKQDILGKKGTGTICVYFSWGATSKPKIEVVFWIEQSNKYWEEIRSLVTSDNYTLKNIPERSDLFIAPMEWGWFCLAYKKELDFFLSNENQTNAIVDWCKIKLKKLHHFMLITKTDENIPWEIKA